MDVVSSGFTNTVGGGNAKLLTETFVNPLVQGSLDMRINSNGELEFNIVGVNKGVGQTAGDMLVNNVGSVSGTVSNSLGVNDAVGALIEGTIEGVISDQLPPPSSNQIKITLPIAPIVEVTAPRID